MGLPNSRRARRRHRGKYRRFYANHVWWGGRWLVRTITTEKVRGGRVILRNEMWNEQFFVPGLPGNMDEQGYPLFPKSTPSLPIRKQ